MLLQFYRKCLLFLWLRPENKVKTTMNFILTMNTFFVTIFTRIRKIVKRGY